MVFSNLHSHKRVGSPGKNNLKCTNPAHSRTPESGLQLLFLSLRCRAEVRLNAMSLHQQPVGDSDARLLVSLSNVF